MSTLSRQEYNKFRKISIKLTENLEVGLKEEEEKRIQKQIQARVTEEDALAQALEFEQGDNIEYDELQKKLLEERALKLQKPWYLIAHNSETKIRWDLLIILFAIWNSISIPFNVCFPEAQFDTTPAMIVVEIIIDVSFGLDICVSFFTSFISAKTGMEVWDLKKIAKNYVYAGRFWIDLLASIPFELIFVPIIMASGGDESNDFAF